MKILYPINQQTVFPSGFSEVYTLGSVIKLLQAQLDDNYALYLKHPDSPYRLELEESTFRSNIMMHISNEIYFDDFGYDQFDYVFRFYLPERCDRKKLFPIPIGVNSGGSLLYNYGENSALSERKHNVFFKGQIHHREQFYKSIAAISIPDSCIEFTDGFSKGDCLKTHQQMLSNSKIILVPKGWSPETFRYAEAFARGCCVITDEPPGQWWHEGSPARFIQDWNQVGEVIQETLASMSETTHLDNRRYYQQKLSPKAIADYIEGGVREACSSKVA